MRKKIFKQVDLTCVFQTHNLANEGLGGTTVAVPGLLSYRNGRILFQETVPRKREMRNARLYEGKLTNLVLRKDGCYHPFIKGYKAGGTLSKQDYAFRVYCEILEALNTLD